MAVWPAQDPPSLPLCEAKQCAVSLEAVQPSFYPLLQSDGPMHLKGRMLHRTLWKEEFGNLKSSRLEEADVDGISSWIWDRNSMS